MKTIATSLLALVLLFAICGSGFSAESDDKTYLAELYQRYAFLENAYQGLVNEHAQLVQAAQPIFAEAEAILKRVKDINKASLADKYKVLTAAFYEMAIENLQLKAMVLEREGFIIKMEIERIENKLKQRSA